MHKILIYKTKTGLNTMVRSEFIKNDSLIKLKMYNLE